MAKPAAVLLNYLLRPSASHRVSSTIHQNVARQSAARHAAAKSATRHQPFSSSPRRPRKQPADDPGFSSIVDNPPELVRTGNKHGWGLMFLAIIPVTAFALGTWQVQRLKWKSELIAKCEDRIVRPPLPLPARIDHTAIADFDYRRVYAVGRFRHDKEMLVGPRVREGELGYMVVTPLEREGDSGATVLVNRGWISKQMADKSRRPEGLPTGEVRVEGMLREPWKKNMFTPDNIPEKGEFYFPDVVQMAALTGSQPVWVEQTMDLDYSQLLDREAKGIPIGRVPEVNLRNTHAQYIFTWYGLAVATSIMFWMVAKKPSKDPSRRVRMNKHW